MSTEGVPSEVYLDTSVVIAALHPGTPNSLACSAYVQRLAEHRARVYFSQALRLDLGRAVRRLVTKPDNLPPHVRELYLLDQWATNPLVRQRWLSRELRLFEGFLEQFTSVAEIPISAPLWRQSIEIMGVDGLDATDAMHIATARAHGIETFATSDRDFRRVTTPRIQLIRDLELV